MSIDAKQIADALAPIAGLGLKVSRLRGGNFKVEFKSLVETCAATDSQSMDERKCRALVKIADTLRAAKLPASVSLAWESEEKDARGKKIFVPWPCVYVNVVARSTAEVGRNVSAIEERMETLERNMALIAKHLTGESASTPREQTSQPDTSSEVTVEEGSAPEGEVQIDF